MIRDELERLSKGELINLVLKLQRPGKTSRTSSLPPSSDQKSEWEPPPGKEERREKSRPGGAKPGHKGHWRELAADPDEFVDHEPDQCPHCLAAFGAEAERELLSESDEIEIPPCKPYVRRHRRFGVRCTHCGVSSEAELPADVQGTPFGPRIHALAIYLKTQQALSYQRLRRVFAEFFGLSVSEGALMNMFKRAGAVFAIEREKALELLRRAKVIASDETGVRVEGVGAYHWVFCCGEAIVHATDFTRAGSVVRDILDGHKPQVWISDRYSAQQGHGVRHQTCLAHLARDVEYADEASDDQAPWRLKLWLQKVFAFARDISTLSPATRRARQRSLQHSIDAILTTPVTCEFARDIVAKFARARDQLLTFCDFPEEVEATNNQSERELRPAVIQRKVTNGYRAKWAADFEADVRTATSTRRLHSASSFHAILNTLEA
jgi:transposase